MDQNTFYISVISIISAAFTLLMRTCIQSKCSNVDLCGGFVNVTRDIHSEETIEIEQMNHPPV